MTEVPVWEVDLYVEGPVAINQRFRTRQQKGLRPENPFYSDIEITSVPSGGLRATVTARASNQRLAFEAAVFFFGRMLDVLAFNTNLPLFSNFIEREQSRNARVRQHVRRSIARQEIESAFREADVLASIRPSFLRSLGWYRKGLYTEDPFDKFLALWIALENTAANYYRTVESIDQERAKNGSKSQIWECFKALWGPCEQWPNIPGDKRWIDENYEIRKDIAHGVSSVSIDKVASVVNELDVIERVAYRFLKDWRDKFLDVDWASGGNLPRRDEDALPY